MNRRGFLSSVSGMLAFGSIPVGRGQDQVRDSTAAGAADPLMRPDWAGRPRAEVEAMDNDPAVKAIEKGLRCTCGCGLDIFVCRTTDFTCTYSPALHRELIELLEAGRTPEQAVDDFVARYGESILMAPKAKGFGALGYVLPGAAITLAGSLLAWVLVRRSRLATEQGATLVAPPAPPPAAEARPDEIERLERAVRELDA